MIYGSKLSKLSKIQIKTFISSRWSRRLFEDACTNFPNSFWKIEFNFWKKKKRREKLFSSIDIFPLQPISTVSTIIKSNAQQKNRYTCANKIELSRALFFLFFFFYLSTKTRRKGLKLILDICILYSNGNEKDRPTNRTIWWTREIYDPTHKCLRKRTSTCTHNAHLPSIKLFESLHGD